MSDFLSRVEENSHAKMPCPKINYRKSKNAIGMRIFA